MQFAVGGVSTTHRDLTVSLVLDEANLVAVTGVQEGQLGVVHRLSEKDSNQLEDW